MRWMTFAAVLAMSMTATAQAAQIYKWVDAQGVTHYDATPPAGQQVESVNIQKPAMAGSVATPTMPADPQPAIDAKVRKQAQAAEAKRTANCELIRTNLAKLKAYARISEPVEDGFKRLSEDERKARIGETEKMIAEHCN